MIFFTVKLPGGAITLLSLSQCSSIPNTATVTGPFLNIGNLFPLRFFSSANKAAFSSASKSENFFRVLLSLCGALTADGAEGKGRRDTSSRRESGRRGILRVRKKSGGRVGLKGGGWWERVVEEPEERMPGGGGESAE